MKNPDHLLTHLIDAMKSASIPNDEFPSKEIQDAYLDFEARLRNTWLYKSLVPTKDHYVGKFKDVKKKIIELDAAGIENTWLDDDLKVLFAELACLILENDGIADKRCKR